MAAVMASLDEQFYDCINTFATFCRTLKDSDDQTITNLRQKLDIKPDDCIVDAVIQRMITHHDAKLCRTVKPDVADEKPTTANVQTATPQTEWLIDFTLSHSKKTIRRFRTQLTKFILNEVEVGKTELSDTYVRRIDHLIEKTKQNGEICGHVDFKEYFVDLKQQYKYRKAQYKVIRQLQACQDDINYDKSITVSMVGVVGERYTPSAVV